MLFAANAATAWCCDPDEEFNSFAAAEFVPADVTTYINVTDGAELRKNLARVPLGQWLTKSTVSPDLVKAWHSLAETAKLSSGELFDVALGKQFTLAVRNSGGAAEWVLICHVEAERAKALLKSLSPRVIDYWQEMPIFDIPEHQLIVARYEDTLLIGPNGRNAKLFASVCNGLVDECDNPLIDDELFERAAEQGDGSLFAFVRQVQPRSKPTRQQFTLVANRHREEPRQDWLAVSATMRGNELSIRHASSKSMFASGATKVEQAWDMAPFNALDDQYVLALIKPIEQDAGIVERVVDQGLGTTDWRVAVESRNTGRRILIVGDKQESFVGGFVMPSVGQALEIECDDVAVANVTTTMRDVNAQIRNLDCGSYLTPSENVMTYRLATMQNQSDDLDRATATFSGLPVMEPMPLQWTVIRGMSGNWCVVSNDPQRLAALADALEAEDEGASPMFGSWVSCGAGDGRKLVDTLKSLTGPGSSMPTQLKAFMESQAVTQVADLAGVIDRFRWALANDEDGILTLDVALQLAQPSSR